MSILASLNSPLVISSAGAIAAVSLPSLEAACVNGSIAWPTIKLINGVLYGLNVYATSQPGRIDGEIAQEMAEGKADPESSSSVPKGRDRSLVTPSGWAFAIWAPIFAGELVFCAAAAALPGTAPVVSVIKKASGGFMISQVFQILWTASFRPKYKGKSALVSATMLSGIAVSLSRAHAAYTDPSLALSMGDYLVYFLPLTLHFGWTTAAALVNLNSSIASLTESNKIVAWTGHASVVAATAAGVAVTLTRQAPVFGGVIAWALSACAHQMKKRLERQSKAKITADAYGVAVQRWLCVAGAIASGATALLVAGRKST